MNRELRTKSPGDWQSLTLGRPYRRYCATDERGPGAGATTGQHRERSCGNSVRSSSRDARRS